MCIYNPYCQVCSVCSFYLVISLLLLESSTALFFVLVTFFPNFHNNLKLHRVTHSKNRINSKLLIIMTIISLLIQTIF